jgi:hypothetical protein
MPHARRRDRVHQPRNGRRRSSELIQHDGDHQRFEGRAKWCTLLVFVDAANSSLQQTQHAAGLGRHSMSAHVSSGRASRDQVALNSRSRDRWGHQSVALERRRVSGARILNGSMRVEERPVALDGCR